MFSMIATGNWFLPVTYPPNFIVLSFDNFKAFMKCLMQCKAKKTQKSIKFNSLSLLLVKN